MDKGSTSEWGFLLRERNYTFSIKILRQSKLVVLNLQAELLSVVLSSSY